MKRTHVNPGGSCDMNKRVRRLHKRDRTRSASETCGISATPTGVGRRVAPARHKRSARRRPGTAVETTNAADGRQLYQLLTNISEPCGSTGVAGDLSGCGRSCELGRCVTRISRADGATVKPVRIQFRVQQCPVSSAMQTLSNTPELLGVHTIEIV